MSLCSDDGGGLDVDDILTVAGHADLSERDIAEEEYNDFVVTTIEQAGQVGLEGAGAASQFM